jgi:hypothetical protein
LTTASIPILSNAISALAKGRVYMTFAKLMDVLKESPVRLQRDGGDLIIHGEEETLTQSLLNGLSAHKAELLDLVDKSNGDWLSPGFIITPAMLPLVQLSAGQRRRQHSGYLSVGAAAGGDLVSPLDWRTGRSLFAAQRLSFRHQGTAG